MAYLFSDDDYTPEYRVKVRSYLSDSEVVNRKADEVMRQSAENAGLSGGEVGSSFVTTTGTTTVAGCVAGGLLGSACSSCWDINRSWYWL